MTGTDAYPDFLKKDVENDTLKVYCNGDIVYKIKGVTAKVSVIWNYTFPKGGGDTHFSVMKGSKADWSSARARNRTISLNCLSKQ